MICKLFIDKRAAFPYIGCTNKETETDPPHDQHKFEPTFLELDARNFPRRFYPHPYWWVGSAGCWLL